jgi:ribosomal protein L24
MQTLKIKKGDTVQMLSGKDRGKQGRIIEAFPRDGKVVVENLNIQKKHQKPRPIRDANRMGGTQIAPGGIIDRPAAASATATAWARTASRSRCAYASARAADRSSTSNGRHRDLRPAPQAAVQRRAAREAP